MRMTLNEFLQVQMHSTYDTINAILIYFTAHVIEDACKLHGFIL